MWGNIAGEIASGFGSSAPAMASGQAGGSSVGVTVGGLSVNKKSKMTELLIAATAGAVLVWIIKK